MNAPTLASRLCGENRLPGNLTSTHDMVFLYFHTEDSVFPGKICFWYSKSLNDIFYTSLKLNLAFNTKLSQSGRLLLLFLKCNSKILIKGDAISNYPGHRLSRSVVILSETQNMALSNLLVTQGHILTIAIVFGRYTPILEKEFHFILPP